MAKTNAEKCKTYQMKKGEVLRNKKVEQKKRYRAKIKEDKQKHETYLWEEKDRKMPLTNATAVS